MSRARALTSAFARNARARAFASSQTSSSSSAAACAAHATRARADANDIARRRAMSSSSSAAAAARAHSRTISCFSFVHARANANVNVAFARAMASNASIAKARASEDASLGSPNGATTTTTEASNANGEIARRRSGVMDVKYVIEDGQGRGNDRVIAVYGIDGERRGEVTLPGRIFDAPLRVDIAHRVVRWQRARARLGLHKTKSRGEVSGTTRKARPQKGQGRARVGNLKAPQMRGGGTAHGPVVRSHEHDLPKKVRRLGLKVALSAKAAEGKIVIVDTFAGLEPKTRVMKDLLERLTGDVGLAAGGVYHSSLIVDGEFEEASAGEEILENKVSPPSALVRLSSRNLPHVQVLPQIGLNVYSILQHRSLILTRGALEQLIARLDAPIRR